MDMEVGGLASASELSGRLLADAGVGASDHHYLPRKLHVCPTHPTSKELPTGKGSKSIHAHPSQSQLRYVTSIQPQRRISSSCLSSGDLNKLIFRGRFPSGKGGLLIISSGGKGMCPEATDGHLGKQRKCS